MRLSLTPLYKTWERMRNRCRNPKYRSFHRYGGRGIAVCDRWDVFENFAADMGPHPGKGWTLERKDNDLGYSKANCRWATAQDQARNKSTTKLSLKDAVEIRSRYGGFGNGPRQTELAREFDVPQSEISKIVNKRIWT